MKSITKIFAALILLISGIATFTSPASASDIVPGSALEKEFRAMIDRGVISGYTDGTYRPTADVTRAQFAAFINRALELPAGTHTFTDVSSNAALGDDIGAVYKAGIMQGVSSSSFRPEALITRAQMALTIQNMIKYSGMDLTQKTMTFTDAASINSGVLRAVYVNAHYGIISGYPNTNTNPVTYSFRPENPATREQAAAFISRFLDALEDAPVPPVTPDEPSVDSDYYLGYVEGGKLVKQALGRESYLETAEAFKATPTAKAIIRGDEIVRIKSGIAYGDRTAGGVRQVTTVYYDKDFRNQATYVEHGREIRYIDANADFIKVQIGGTIGYAKHSEVNFIPYELITNRDYFTKNQWGTLEHYEYNHVTQRGGTHTIGPAPAEMQTGVRYYSHDGVNFANSSGRTLFEHYPYFQFQSIRTKTSYSAADLDRFIMHRLSEVNSDSGYYKDALKRSKLIGMGEHFIKLQNQHNVNALFMLAAAMHESASGMSENALTKNNLFGIKVYDSSPEAGAKYPNPQASIEAFAKDYMNKNYTNPHGAYANGAVPGNKTAGFNVSYASDPKWGSKIAGHMFRADLYLGQRDIGRYDLGITNTPSVNVRKAPQGEIQYTYKRTNLGVDGDLGYPVVIAGEVKGNDGYIWYKVHSDLNTGGYSYIRSDLIDRIN